jgi:hypothetical protein
MTDEQLYNANQIQNAERRGCTYREAERGGAERKKEAQEA